MLNTPFSPWPSFTEEEVNAVRQVLLSNRVNYWTGSECRKFEKEFATWTDARYAIGVGTGTLALEVALKALDIGPGDEVVVTPRTFIASISCVVAVGATPVFADVDPNSGNLSAKTIATVLTSHTKAVIVVHLAGWPADMHPIMHLATQHDVKVIEDCAQAHGARYKGHSVGSIGHIGAWSFCQDKIMTTGGEGGMVTTNDPDLWLRMWSYKDHGKSWEAAHEHQHSPGFRWLHKSFGTNLRMMEMQAAIGRIQLSRMPEWTQRRVANAVVLTQALQPYAEPNGVVRLPVFSCTSDCDCLTNAQNQTRTVECVHAQYKFYCYIRPEKLTQGWNRHRILEEINNLGVPCYQGSCSEVYLERAFDNTDYRPAERLPVARELGDTSLMFLVHPTLTEAEINKTATAVTTVLQQASNHAVSG